MSKHVACGVLHMMSVQSFCLGHMLLKYLLPLAHLE